MLAPGNAIGGNPDRRRKMASSRQAPNSGPRQARLLDDSLEGKQALIELGHRCSSLARMSAYATADASILPDSVGFCFSRPGRARSLEGLEDSGRQRSGTVSAIGPRQVA